MATSFADRDIVTVSSKGQVTIPKHIREQFGIDIGTKLQFVRSPSGVLTIVPKTGTIEDLFGMLRGKHRTPLTIEELSEAAAQAAAASGMRGMESWSEPVWEDENWELR